MSKYPNSGTLGKNTRRRPDSKDPNSSGKASITCPCCDKESEFWLSGWTKQGQDGPWVSLSFKAKDAPQSDQPIASEPEPFNDDIPF